MSSLNAMQLIARYADDLDTELRAAAIDSAQIEIYAEEIFRTLGRLDVALANVRERKENGKPFDGCDVLEMLWHVSRRPSYVIERFKHLLRPELADRPDDIRRLAELLDTVLGDE